MNQTQAWWKISWLATVPDTYHDKEKVVFVRVLFLVTSE